MFKHLMKNAKKIFRPAHCRSYVRWRKLDLKGGLGEIIEIYTHGWPLSGSDVDPDPVGSAFIWVCRSGSRGIK